ncbi:MAG: dNTP triphosphohydrolase, partial [Planctomycetes bacterium]|nr:dNTP triphosphohydrolase [Planctomycetota bacterium]
MGVVDLYQNGDRSRERAAAQTHEARTPWRRDYARVIHCSSFRRLQGKTQLFPTHESDVFRNRLTHSLEVAQIAKGIAGRLNKRHCYFRENNLSIELIETAALAHDLGHPPFGHDGELALDRAMKAFFS